MSRGRQSRLLRPDQIERLEKFRRAPHEGAPHGYSLPQLRSAMGAGFSWKTLQKALQGLPVWDLYHAYIVQWIDRYLPMKLPRDGKAAAAGGRIDAIEDFVNRGRAAQEDVDEAVEDAKRNQESESPRQGEQHKEEAGTTRTVRGSR